MRMALLSLAVWLTGSAAHAQGPSAAWYSIETDAGARLGHASFEVTRGSDGETVIQTHTLLLQEQGAAAPTRITTRTVQEKDAEGRTLTLESVTTTGRARTVDRARIEPGVAIVTRETAVETREIRIPLPPEARFDNGEPLLAAWDRRASPRLEFPRFNLDALAVERVVIEPASAPAEHGVLIRRHYQGDVLTAIARLDVDDLGRMRRSSQPLFGATLAVRAVDRQTALAAHEPFRVFESTATPSPVRIPDSAARGRLRYSFAFRDGFEFAAPQTGQQRVRTETAGTMVVDVCAGCGPGLAKDPASLAEALRPTAWLQSDHPRIKSLADPIAQRALSESARMQALSDLARPYVADIDFAGHFSALETVARRRGDCTEAAVLLAALGRAAGIPTKVASGLVYAWGNYRGASNSFIPHSWVVAYVDGEWKSLDAALDGFGSTHIALTVSDGEPRSIAAAGQLAGLLDLEAVNEVRPRPAP